MLATRIIPTLLSKGGSLVKGRGFNHGRVIGHVRQAARIFEARGVDELIVLDVTATAEGRGPDLELVRDIASECFMPLTVGGGVRNVEDVKALLASGADKVAICTAALDRPEFIAEAAQAVGSQAVVASIDVGAGVVFARRGQARTVRPCVDWARECAARGAGEILLNSIERDGTLGGYDLAPLQSVAQAVTIPVVASGGCGTYEHMIQALQAGAHAVAAGAMWSFCDATPREAALYLAERGFAVRLDSGIQDRRQNAAYAR